MRRTLRDNGLSIVIFLFFVFSLAGQILAGVRVYNDDQREHHLPPVTMGEYLRTGHFVEALFENWESEFLQMGMYVVLTVMLFQRGSSESKDPDKKEEVDEDPRENRKPDSPLPVQKGGGLLRVYEHSLSITLFALFAASFLLHAAGGASAFSEEQRAHGGEPVGMLAYMATSRFWFESFQNWQSEFFSMFALVVLSIVLREKGSPESKPVAAAHSQTGA
jgi:membrane protein implicated in regulation of membrane protease activity